MWWLLLSSSSSLVSQQQQWRQRAVDTEQRRHGSPLGNMRLRLRLRLGCDAMRCAGRGGSSACM